MPDNALSDAELAALPAHTQHIVREAWDACSNANSIFDLGFARGLLACLHRTGELDKSHLDRAYKRGVQLLHPRILREIQELSAEAQAHLGAGIIVPAAPGTRKQRG